MRKITRLMKVVKVVTNNDVELLLPGGFSNENLVKRLEEVGADGIKSLDITVKKLYMSEEDFIKYAKEDK